jgi:hypothetical protein
MWAVEAALAVIWLSIGLGAALGLGQRWAPWATNAIRTFAVLAAVLVVALALLPHALMDETLVGLLGGALGYAAIPGLERVALWLTRGTRSAEWRLEISYAGLLLHRLGDGVAMSAQGHGYAVLWAIGAHEIPIVALVTLAYARRGALVGLARAVALGLASSLGLALVRALPLPTWHALHGWTDALAAGVLIHIVVHESSMHRSSASSAASKVGLERFLDLGAAALAVGLIALPACTRDPLVQALVRRAFERLLDLTPLTALGLGLLALCRAWGSPPLRASGSARSGNALRLAIPHLEPPSLALFTALLGWQFTLHQVVIGSAAAGLAALTSSWFPLPPLETEVSSPAFTSASSPMLAHRWLCELEKLIVPTFGWLVLGVFAASLIEQLVPGSAITGHGRASWSWAALLASLASACMPAAAPVAAALILGGLQPGLALAALLLGPAARLLAEAATTPRERRINRSAALVSVAVACPVAFVGWNQLQASVLGMQRTPASGTALGWFCLVVFAATAGKSIWQFGVRGWLRASMQIRGALDPESMPHAHGELAVHFFED